MHCRRGRSTSSICRKADWSAFAARKTWNLQAGDARILVPSLRDHGDVSSSALILPRRSRSHSRGSSRDRSEEHTSELQSLMRISYAVLCLKKTQNSSKTSKNKTNTQQRHK